MTKEFRVRNSSKIGIIIFSFFYNIPALLGFIMGNWVAGLSLALVSVSIGTFLIRHAFLSKIVFDEQGILHYNGFKERRVLYADMEAWSIFYRKGPVLKIGIRGQRPLKLGTLGAYANKTALLQMLASHSNDPKIDDLLSAFL